jgi:hypothetical protein
MNPNKTVILLIFCLIAIIIGVPLWWNQIRNKNIVEPSYHVEILRTMEGMHEKYGHTFLAVGVFLENFENMELNVTVKIMFTWGNESGHTITNGIIPSYSNKTLQGHFEIPYVNVLGEIESSAEILNITATS